MSRPFYRAEPVHEDIYFVVGQATHDGPLYEVDQCRGWDAACAIIERLNATADGLHRIGVAVAVWAGMAAVQQRAVSGLGPNGEVKRLVPRRGAERVLRAVAVWGAMAAGRARGVGLDGQRDPNHPCDSFVEGRPAGFCDGDGHYLCRSCTAFSGRKGSP